MDVAIRCRAETHAKTGVEMEALTGASVAALTLYDMGKSAGHGIVIRDIRLLEKTGGKKNGRAKHAPTSPGGSKRTSRTRKK